MRNVYFLLTCIFWRIIRDYESENVDVLFLGFVGVVDWDFFVGFWDFE